MRRGRPQKIKAPMFWKKKKKLYIYIYMYRIIERSSVLLDGQNKHWKNKYTTKIEL